MRYAVVIESDRTNCSAYAPDLSGYGAGDTYEVIKNEIHDALRFHIKMMKVDGF